MHSALLIAALAAGQLASKWIPNSEQDGITTFLHEPRPATGIAFRGEGLVDAPLAAVVTAMTDVERVAQWMPDTIELRVVKILPNADRLVLDRASMPFPFKNRDYLVSFHLDVDAAAQRVTITERSVDDPEFPPTEGDVRGTVERSVYVMEARATKTFVSLELVADPGGEIPIWLVDAFASESPRKTLAALRGEVARRGFKINPGIADLLRKTP